ncbi:hypothetical protein [Spirosoma sp. 209]|uniref:hypothetical protein n=1 Tax=Spirosoma sp. 209 TaxID=1955701 RepID=UPI00098CF769|nr:hypothetical protein [Spirosoma sp. 209]
MKRLLSLGLLTVGLCFGISLDANAGVMAETIEREQLIEKLSTSDSFEKYAMNVTIMAGREAIQWGALTSEEAVAKQTRLKKLLEQPAYLLSSQKDELAQLAGYADWALYEKALITTLSLRDKLLATFPELKIMSQDEAASVLTTAYYRLQMKMGSGRMIAGTAQEVVNCIERAKVKFNECVNGKATAGTKGGIISKINDDCTIAVILASIVFYFKIDVARVVLRANHIQLIDGGVNFVHNNAIFTSLPAMMSSCAVISGVFILTNYSTKVAACKAQLTKDIDSCKRLL